MARKPGKGRLIALEGTRGPDVAGAARRLVRFAADGKGGISWWDASGTFYEMRLGKPKLLDASARTLVLLYASDLVFRLRWEIRPALQEGRVVIAAPYLDSVMAFGEASGLPRAWLAELFTFAPKPQVCYRVKERKKRSAWKGKPTDGFFEFCRAALGARSPDWDAAELRHKMIGVLEALEDRGGCRRITKKALGRGG